MDVDPIATANLVTREVRTGSRNGIPTRTVVASRTYPTDQADLWDALTNAERLPRWFLPVSGDLRVGGRYQLEGNAEGVIESCDAPERLAVTWEFGGQVSWLEVRLIAALAGTTLELAHEGPADPEFWAKYGPGAGGVGWDLGLVGLGLHLESGESVDPEAGAAWPATPAGIEFVQRAAADWGEAAIRDGDDRTAAQQAASRTVAFYTGQTEDASEA